MARYRHPIRSTCGRRRRRLADARQLDLAGARSDGVAIMNTIKSTSITSMNGTALIWLTSCGSAPLPARSPAAAGCSKLFGEGLRLRIDTVELRHA